MTVIVPPHRPDRERTGDLKGKKREKEGRERGRRSARSERARGRLLRRWSTKQGRAEFPRGASEIVERNLQLDSHSRRPSATEGPRWTSAPPIATIRTWWNTTPVSWRHVHFYGIVSFLFRFVISFGTLILTYIYIYCKVYVDVNYK